MSDPSDRDREMARALHLADGNDIMYALATARAEGYAAAVAEIVACAPATTRTSRPSTPTTLPRPAWSPMPAAVDTPAVEQHAYTSTACIHAEHEKCRRTCKFCAAPCRCACHTRVFAVDVPLATVCTGCGRLKSRCSCADGDCG